MKRIKEEKIIMKKTIAIQKDKKQLNQFIMFEKVFVEINKIKTFSHWQEIGSAFYLKTLLKKHDLLYLLEETKKQLLSDSHIIYNICPYKSEA